MGWIGQMPLSSHKLWNDNGVSSVYPYFVFLHFNFFPLGLRITGYTDINANTDTNSNNYGDGKNDQIFRHKNNSC